jgi:flagellin
MIINHNMGALNANRNMNINSTNAGKSMEKLSSGMRINRAGDDAAGLAISEKMRGQIRGLDQASANAQDGISLIQTAEGGLNETHSILQRMRELAVQGASDTLQPEDRAAVSTELTQLNSEIDRIAGTTKFNGKSLLNGTMGVQMDKTAGGCGLAAGSDGITSIDISGAAASTTYTIAVGSAAGKVKLTSSTNNVQEVSLADATAGVMNFDKLGIKVTVNDTWAAATLAAAAHTGVAGTIKTTADAATNFHIGSGTGAGEDLGLSINKMDSSATGLNTAGIAVDTNAHAKAAIDSIDAAINSVSAERSKLGANQNRLEHTINNLGTSSENLTSAESRRRDVDMAKEMSTFSKNNILSQAAQAMLAQANQQPQQVLQLLR